MRMNKCNLLEATRIDTLSREAAIYPNDNNTTYTSQV